MNLFLYLAVLLSFVPSIAYAFPECAIGREGFACHQEKETKKEKQARWKKEEAEAKNKEAVDAIAKETRCESDNDCASFGSGGCVLKNSTIAKNLKDVSDNNGSCKCLTGPTVFGCIPASQYDMYQSKQAEKP